MRIGASALRARQIVLAVARYSFPAIAIALPCPSFSADIRRSTSTDGGLDVITLQGPIEIGDDQRFLDAITLSKNAVVILNSEGGKIAAALPIGEAIAQRKLATAVSQQGLCASACALIWLAGIPRYASQGANIGFHAAYLVENGQTKEVGSANALVGAYLNRLGMSSDAVIFVTSAPPEGMTWLTADTAKQVGIAYELLSEEPEEPTEGSSVLPEDPMTTVLAFYRALSAADGEGASALVIPEKRGKGPFNEQSIHSFFGAMRSPLKIRELALVNDDTLRVRYTYRTSGGRSCEGRADVKTTAKYGRIFIEKIKALDGC